ncbi:MAG: PSD1 and planctomycete cytochrome C domain-containing protein [Planctomycetota bacterium]|nr:PSD1 and planctomycete cytochrome C domain-containing protein [Planctomycetota bacterium]
MRYISIWGLLSYVCFWFLNAMPFLGALLCFGALPCWGQVNDAEFFEKQVRPILAQRCWSCHSGESGESKGGLRLDHIQWIQKGGDSGPAVSGGDVDGSLIYQAVSYQGYEMPPDGRLPKDQVEVLREWIARGAYWPDEPLPEDKQHQDAFDLEARRQSHWVWNPRSEDHGSEDHDRVFAPDPWSSGKLDAMVMHKLHQQGLEPNATTGRSTLVRRVYLDLIGIPPTREELEQALAASDPDWYAKLVDSLLANPQFGVRWARHWLDLVRFAQSRGHEFDEDIPSAEPYRDYVVRALNADVPYDQFLVEHLAGDLLKAPRVHPTLGWNESVLGTGFWHLGEWVHSPVDTRKDQTDRFDNMVDVFSKTFLGVTVACARCHDHKFDAISQDDYYAIYGYLKSSDYRLVRFETDVKHRDLANARREKLEILEATLQKELSQQIQRAEPKDFGALKDSTAEVQAVAQTANAIAKFGRFAESMYPIEDPRVVFDARRPDAMLWQSDSVIYGASSKLPGSVSLDIGAQSSAWKVHLLPEAWRDPFWNPMTQTSHGVNRLNRHPQINEAGKIMPTAKFALKTGKVSYLVRGSFRAFASIDSHRLIAGPLHGETVFENGGDDNEYRWVTQSLDRHQGKTIHLEFSPLQDKPFGLVQVIEGPAPAVGPIPGIEPADAFGLWNATRELALRSLQNPELELSTKQRTEIAAWTQGVLDRSEGHVFAEWAKQSSESDAQLAKAVDWHSQLALAMRDGDGINDSILIRGNPSKPGAEVPRRNLTALGGKQKVYQGPGSGRLELAEQLVQQDNPLVARVIVNRLWHHLMGRGIVPTTDDFGVLGTRPTHPELLDELAEELIESGWSLKSMIKTVCLSSVYQQDSKPSTESREKDPDNQWLSHARVRRLESESIRDTLLAISGQLDNRATSADVPSIPVHLTEFLEGRGRPGRNGPLDGAGKRSLYLEVRRNFLNPMMSTFDTPSPFSSMGRRNVSNVPAQSLILLNDPLVHQLAERWSDRILQEQPSDTERIRTMWLTAFSREPTPLELELMDRFVHSQDFTSPKEAYRSLAHMLMNNKEAIYRF